ncbi:piezo-type mechanosensitive ion channel component-like isoform X3 [Neocloeon triangulifer]|uniref:piezo-type mechanosensitive ion channel component-like isoform X3 n=1 Tax=Neocloeon triangulifer TaxID=2078957 RepID=UPI00286F1D57|nr:piezo-type mechanosensitive ion channel component-like isoform X3 [Neocloeon triangulifer]
MTTTHLVCFTLFRLVLPLCLATFVAVRQNGLSLVYLLLLLCLPLIPVPTHATMKGHTGRYLQAFLVLSLLNVIAQVAFQVLLLAMPPYAFFLHNCEWLEVLLRALGFVRFDDIALPDVARIVGPDIGALITSIVMLMVCKNMCEQPEPTQPDVVEQQSNKSLSHIFTSLGKFFVLGSLCLAGSIRPSLPGAVYFVCFLGGATAWACRNPLTKGFAHMMQGCAAFCLLHVLALFTYQVEWFQEIDGLGPTNLTARLLGLTPLTMTSCEEPRHVMLVDAEWATFVNPLVLLWLYFLLVHESKQLLDPAEVSVGLRKEVSNGPLSLGSSKQNSLLRRQGSSSLNNKRQTSRRRTLRWKGPNALANQRRLMRGQQPTNYETVTDQQAVNGASQEGSAVNLQDSTVEDALEEQEETSIFELLVDSVMGLLNLIIRSSYIATNIIMMAWSIAYHSWLTFVLLLWASILWITPNQRRAMLRCSPALAIYAQLLLIAQYIYSLDLTNEELPETVDWVNLKQIGLIKPEYLPLKPLSVKSSFTLMFWVTLRQYMQERYEAKHSSALVGGIAEPFNITVTTTASGLTSELTEQTEGHQAARQSLMSKLGAWVQSFLTKFWIWVVAIMLFVIGLGSGQVVLYRIVYMALFLIFVLTFQFSYRIWRVMMYGFWLTVIVYSMLVLVMIYTYQFDNFPEYWYNYTGIPHELQHDIGLEIYDTGSLFVRLLTPTFFVIITVIQLHYFHKDFLAISDIRYRVLSDNDPESGLNSLTTTIPPSGAVVKSGKQISEKLALDEPITPKDLSYEAIRKMSTAQFARLANKTKTLAFELQELLWRLLELHMVKITLISVMLMAVNDVCGAHAILVVLIVAAMPLGTRMQRALLHVCSGLVCLLILTQMTYQIKYINHSYWDVNCTDLPNFNVTNTTVPMNDAEWLGVKKSSDLPELLKGYIGLVLVFTFQAVVRTRQQYQRRSTMSADPPSSPTSRDTSSTAFTPIPVLFNGVTRANADEGIITCIKYLLNYGFYKFGVEICLMTLVILIGTRLDMYSIIYSIWLAFLFKRPRLKLSLVWRWLIIFVCVLTPLQYFLCVGLPPGLCIDWPWDKSETLRRLQIWLFMSDYVHPPECQKLICDFVVLLLICRQQIVFRVEKAADSTTFAGGSNAEVFDQLDDLQDNPVPDFITYTKSWLDNIKRGVLRHFYWFTLIMVLVTGVNRNNLFSLGYLVGAFFFLHHGNDLYLLPVRKILYWWNILLSYNVAVIGLKAFTQMLGCLFVGELQTHTCWLVQLLSITCLSKFGSESQRASVTDSGECTVSSDQTGLVWDGVCFGFLLMQRRLFSSFYFARIVDEAKAQTILASRGAELIEQLRRKRVAAQKEEEQRVLDKIRTKMERIKENQRKMQGENFREPQSHQRDKMHQGKIKRRPSRKVKAIRSGDYYMFEDFDDDLLDLSLDPARATVEDVDEEGDESKVTVSKYPVYPYVLIASPYLHCNRCRIRKLPSSSHTSSLRPQLLSTALKTDIETAADQALVANLQDSPIPMADEPTPKPRRRKRSTVSYLSGKSELAQPSTSVSARSSFQSSRIPPLNEDEEPGSPSPPPPPPGGSGGAAGQAGGADSASKEDSWASKLWVYMKFLWALLQSGVVSATKKLNKLSRDYRYVAQCLAAETLSLKEQGDYRLGTRVGQGMWRPLAVTLPEKVEGSAAGLEIRIVGASDEATLNVDQGEIQQQAINADQRSEEKIPIPTIKIWAASLERGLDSDRADSPISISDIDGRGTAFQKDGEPISLTTGLFHALWFAVLAHSELVCYGMVFLHQVKSASILSLPLPLMVFLWGSLSVPRPSKFFWVTIIGYTEMVVIAKYLCQFEYLPWNQQAIPYNQPFWGPRITGVERKEMYALFDLMLLLVVFFHRFMLKSLGLWGDCDESKLYDIGEPTVDTASSPTVRTKSPEPSDKSSSKENDEDISEMSSAPIEGCGTALTNKVKQTAANLPAPLIQVPSRLFSSISSFFSTLLEPSSRVTADVYAFMFMCDFFNFMVVIFGFASFGTQQGDGGVSAYLEENKVPVAFLVMLILQFALMVVDRALFLRKFILGKIMFQVGLVFGVHLWMFFLLPGLTERPFSGALPPQIWYLVKCLYLLLSAYQIRCGYPTRILGNFLCKKYNYLNMFLFKGFMAVPFLFELRTLMDWMWTKTSMTLGEWIKMEDIFAHIFQLKCQRRAEAAYPRPPGEEQRPLIKYVVGGCSLLVVIFIIWFPMVLFALGNTVGQPNLPYDVSVELTIGPYQPVFRTSAQNSSLIPFSEGNWEALSNVYKRDRAAQTFLSNYDWSDVQVAKIDNFSMSVWTISEQAQKKMMAYVLSDEPLLVKFSWMVSRHSDNPSTVPVVTETQTNFLMATLPNGERNPERLTLANMLNDSYNGSLLKPLRLQNLFPKFIKVSNRGKATVVTQLMKKRESTEETFRDLLLTLDRDDENREHWWEVGESCTDEEYKDLLSHLPLNDRCKSLQMYTFNDKAFPAGLSFFSGGGIIGLYTTLVLVASKFMRGFFSGVCFTIMFDDLPDVDRILQLCLDIYLVRESGELSLEEALAAKLIFLFRSPSTLIKWSRPREEEDGSEASSDEDLRSRQGSRQQAIMQ